MSTSLDLWTGQRIPRLGVGCWAIGGSFSLDGRADGWGVVDDAQSLRALALAHDLGARLFDTADVYGTGHSETLLGTALQGRPDAVIATKFGFRFDAARREVGGTDLTPEYMEQALAASLRRLRRDHVGLYQIHPGGMDRAAAERLGEALERRVAAGDIGAWGWSTDDPAAAAIMLQFPGFRAVQHELSLLHPGTPMLDLARTHGLVSLNRSPLAMGLLTGKFRVDSALASDDVRGAGHSWVRHFADGRPDPAALARIARLRELLTVGGRSPAQGSLGWILARAPNTLPIPGFKTPAQVRDNLGAIDKGPLPADIMHQIDVLLAEEDASIPAT